MNIYLSFVPLSSNAFIVVSIAGIVVVSKADKQTISAPISSAFSTNFSSETSTPKSTISIPAPSIIILTKFLPISCKSPFTVPITALPIGSTPSAFKDGAKTLSPACIALAAINISGTYICPSLNLSPISPIAAIKPLFNISAGFKPCSKASLTNCFDCFPLPFCTANESSLNSINLSP